MSKNENNPPSSEPPPAPFYHPMQVTDDEIDLRVLFSVLWQGKWWIVLFSLLSGLVGGYYAVSLPNIYESQVLVAPVSGESMNASSMLANQFGGLSSLVGINLGGGHSDKITVALQVLQSRKFIGHFIKRHNLIVPVMAIKGWDQGTDQFRYKTKIYDPDRKQWLTDDDGKTLKPRMLDAVNYFIKNIMTVHLDSKTGMVTVSIDFYSPVIAQQWATILIAELNDEIRQQDMLDAQNRIEYLNQQLTKTNIADSRKMLYQLIEQQTKTLMLTNVSKEYIFRTIDPAVENIAPVKPKKLLIIAVAISLGLIMGIMFVFIRSLLSEK